MTAIGQLVDSVHTSHMNEEEPLSRLLFPHPTPHHPPLPILVLLPARESSEVPRLIRRVGSGLHACESLVVSGDRTQRLGAAKVLILQAVAVRVLGAVRH